MSNKIEICPFCKILYGVNVGVDVLTAETRNNIWYRCKGAVRHEFCEHMYKATRKDRRNFACGNCYADTIEECECYDCTPGVFCGRCNRFYDLSCSDLARIIAVNEEESAK